jgi:hypothetical protein
VILGELIVPIRLRTTASLFNGMVRRTLTLAADLPRRSIAKSFSPEFIVTSSHATERGGPLM